MLRFMLFLLIVANAGLFYLSSRENHVKENVLPALNENSIAIISAKDRAPKAKRTVIEDQGNVGGCYELGPFQNTQAVSVRNDLRGRIAYREETQMIQVASWMVATGYFPTRLEAERRITALLAQEIPGAGELSVTGSIGAFMVSMGVYNTKEKADDRLRTLTKMGVDNVIVLPRGDTGSVFFFEK
ncbi:MAG: hypothetical protein LBG61_03445, partial [Burkholderiales bacterium]|nr:hypothetical protein [Burkholderiales bacterium]